MTPRAVQNHYAVAFAFVTATYPGGDPTALLKAAVAQSLASATSGLFQGGVTYPAAVFFALNAPDVPHENLAYVGFSVITSDDYRNAAGVWPDSVTALAGNPVTVSVTITYPLQITAAPVPAVIFQHGLGSCKNESVLAVADSFAQTGFAVVGIDIIEFGDRARTNANPANDAASPKACDQVVDGKLVQTGEGLIRLDNLAATRDALRQTALDQVALLKALRNGEFAAVRPGGDFVSGAETFAGTGLGAMVGTMFFSGQELLNTGVFNVAGAWLSRVFTESPTLGPPLLQTLAAASGSGAVSSAEFQDFLTKLLPLVQGLIDPADPATIWLMTRTGILSRPINPCCCKKSPVIAWCRILHRPILRSSPACRKLLRTRPRQSGFTPFPFRHGRNFHRAAMACC